ncbi:unnamed protein product, partial [Didymodactylos carnosus]
MLFQRLLLISFFRCIFLYTANWTVEYIRGNPDGYYRVITTINNQSTPGPTIEVYENEIVDIHLHNKLSTETVSVHWHGMHQTQKTGWMDGVPYVTMYPVAPGEVFHYQFQARQIGTHWYHSHAGVQYPDGVFGAIIVKDKNDLYTNKIKTDYTVILNDWYHHDAIELGAELADNVHPDYFPEYVSGLMNGKGRYNCSTQEIQSLICVPNHEYQLYNVELNQIYRFRIISAASGHTFNFSIDNHDLTIIAMDGIYVEPFVVQRLKLYVAQRYDILVTMNQPIANYWIRATIFDSQVIKGILHYANAPDSVDPTSQPSEPKTVLINSMQLSPTVHIQYNESDPFEQWVLNFTCRNDSYKCEINGVQFGLPNKPTLLSMYEKDEKHKAQTHIIEVPTNTNVRLILNNLGSMSHPFHIHGHDFYVLGIGDAYFDHPHPFDNDTKKLRFNNPPKRDTEQINEYSWMVLQFYSNNPGSWFFHCHIDWHLEAGLALVINYKDGSSIEKPPNDYPIKTNYKQADAAAQQRKVNVIILLPVVIIILQL